MSQLIQVTNQPVTAGLLATASATRASLVREQAVEQFESFLGNYQGLNETLLRLGLRREDLTKLLDDDEITQTTDTRRDEVTSTPWSFEPSNHPQVPFYLEQLRGRMDEILELMWGSILYGINVQEVIFGEPKSGVYPIVDVVEKPFSWFTIDRKRQLYYRNKATAKWDPCLPVKYITTIRRPSYINTMGEGILAKLYWPWFFRCNGWQYWMALLERFGLPFLVGKTRQGRDPVTQEPYTKIMMEVLDKARQGSSIAIDKESELAVLQTEAGTNNSNFRDFEHIITGRIQKVVLGQTMTSDIKERGSFAAAKSGHITIETKRRSDIELLRRSFQRWLNDYHALCGFQGPAPLFFMQDPMDLAHERAKRDLDLQDLGVRFEKEYIGEHYGLDDEEFSMATVEALPPRSRHTPVEKPKMRVDGVAALLAPAGHGEPKLTDVQQTLEELVASTTTLAGEPLTPAALRLTIMKSADEADLAARLARLIDEQDPKFLVILARAMFAAQVLGYVNQHEHRV